MDYNLTAIVSKGLSFREQYNFQDTWNQVVYKFVIDAEPSEQAKKSITLAIKKALTAAKFPFSEAGFQKGERAKGDDYWAFAVTVLNPLPERPLDRDIHGNLIYFDTKKRAA